MPEIELKLQMAPRDAARLLSHALIRSQGQGRPRRQVLLNIYYDTPDHQLRQRRIALRLRRSGRQWVQTLKAEGRVTGGLHARPEWETATRANTLALDEIPDASLRKWFADPELRRALRPVFQVAFTRTLLDLHWSRGDRVELAVDRGHILTVADDPTQRTEPFCELELELKCGVTARLFTLARMLQKTLPLRLCNVSKAERGYRLALGEGLHAVKASLPAREDAATAGEWCNATLARGLAHLQANEEGVRLTGEPEFVHQARVATRRLRAALRTFKPLLPPELRQTWQDELRWLGQALDGARNWDVFVTVTLARLRQSLPEEPALAWLFERSASQRRDQRRHARDAFDSPRYQQLLLGLGAWLATPAWADAVSGERLAESPSRFGAAELGRRHRRLKKQVRDLINPSMGELHELRIAGKKLRYTAECLAPCFGRGRARHYLRTLEKLLDALGTLNDEATTARLMNELSTRAPAAAEQRACGLALGWAAGMAGERLPEARKACRAFLQLEPFWVNGRGDSKSGEKEARH